MTNPSRYLLFQVNATEIDRIKQLYSEKSRDGNIQINLDRDPDFFEALQVEGNEHVVYAVEDRNTGLIAGAGTKSIRKCYINGEVKKIGYLSGLRIGEAHRKTRVMFMIFAKLRQYYEEGECFGYLISVFNDNTNAIKVLTSGKAGMPTFNSVGQFNTYIFKPKPLHSKKLLNIIIRQAQTEDISNLVAFLNAEGRKQQFFPYYSQHDFENNSGLLKNISINNIYIAIENNEIIGCLTLWDQTPFRRWRVDGYSHLLKILRPFLNVLLNLFAFPGLPKEQTSINYRLLSLVCIRNYNRNIFTALFNQAILKTNKKEQIIISASFFNNDPLIKALPKFKFSLKSSIFIGSWEETQAEIESIDKRFPYLEAGSL